MDFLKSLYSSHFQRSAYVFRVSFMHKSKILINTFCIFIFIFKEKKTA